MSTSPNRRRRCALTIALATLLSACAVTPSLHCASDQQLMVSETLYFGTAMPGGIVGAEDWQSFLAEVVTPRFPDGFTTWTASGQWRGADGGIAREDSRVLNVVHDGSPARREALDAISREYRERFRQEAVLRTSAPVCAGFR